MLNILICLCLIFAHFSEGQAEGDVEHLSLVTTPVLLFRGTALVSQGTGFYASSAESVGELGFG